MKKILLLCSLLMISPTLMAEDTATETCANGAGTIITGAVSKTKYCMSNNAMNWWNAVSWCNSLGKKLFDFSSCACGNTTSDCANNHCPELTNVGSVRIWTTKVIGPYHQASIHLSSGNQYGHGLNFYYDFPRGSGYRTLCE